MVNNFLVTGCTHYGHYNVIRYCNRPFKTLAEMDTKLIKNANERAKEDLTIYHLGDVCFRNSKGGKVGEGTINKFDYYKSQLIGNYIFVSGNHDSNNGIKTKNHRIILNIAGIYVNLIHNPAYTIIEDESYYYPLTLNSHVHTAWKTKEICNKNGKIALCINCGVDQNEFRPISWDEIYSIYCKWLHSHPRRKEINRGIIESRTRPIYVKDK